MIGKNTSLTIKMFVCFLMASFCSLNSFSQESVRSNAVVKEVVIFTSGAEVLNKVNVNLPKGSTKLYIQNVARDIDLNTVQISGPDGIVVLSISQAEQGYSGIISPAHQRVKDSLDLALARKETLVNKQSATAGALKILNKDELYGSGGKVDLMDLTKLVDYYQVKAFELNSTLASIKKSIELEDEVIRKLQDDVRSFSAVGGQIVVQMNNVSAVRADLIVSYITYSASWQAYYDLKSKSITSPLDILYKAKVRQYSGVDWKNIKLSLSTGNPTQSGTAPLLSASYVRYIAPNEGTISAINQRSQNRMTSNSMKNSADMVYDEVASMEKNIASPATTVVENQLNVVFDIDLPYDIVSNGEPHSVTLKEFSQPASYRYYAVPKIEKDAFLLAEIKDFERLNLVSGEANVIFENMFVGTSFLNTNITTDTLTLSMGRDKSISIKRDRIMDAKSSQVSGGYKKQTYTYDIRVRNGKASAIDLILKDQFPISTDKSIEIELVDNGGANVNKEIGILTWPVNIKAGETKTYRFTFTVKYPKDRVISLN